MSQLPVGRGVCCARRQLAVVCVRDIGSKRSKSEVRNACCQGRCGALVPRVALAECSSSYPVWEGTTTYPAAPRNCPVPGWGRGLLLCMYSTTTMQLCTYCRIFVSLSPFVHSPSRTFSLACYLFRKPLPSDGRQLPTTRSDLGE